ncbi:MAG TPA: hypothetical protein VMG41_15540 [Gemmatimonadales bacterium]|nr:hypothetical protein [Gemmatimonadales bacterium]
MSLSPTSQRLALGLAIALLIGMAWLGLSGGIHQLPEARSAGQEIQTVAQLGYGLLAILCLLTTFRGRRWRSPVQACWAIAVTIAGGFAAVVWGGTSLVVGVLSGAASLLVALVILWLLRVGAESLTRP